MPGEALALLEFDDRDCGSDGFLEGLVEGEMTVDQIAAKGYDPATIRRVWRMLDVAEYKRRQAPPGVKITRRAFGRDRRYPITNGFGS